LPETQIPQPPRDPVEGFMAEVMTLILKYRGIDGRNRFDPFVADVTAAQLRYRRKGHDNETSDKIDAIAERAIARARYRGFTAFEPKE
jgi:hypothetical protein